MSGEGGGLRSQSGRAKWRIRHKLIARILAIYVGRQHFTSLVELEA
jgi:hypothetical protein